MTDAPSSFQDAVAALSGEGHRVWSLIVTIFGDMAQTEGAEISGPVLSRITDPIGVKPQALRVALHRLRKDGWIDSRKSGRSSLYQLTPSGRAESARATPRIYATRPPAPDSWHLLVLPSASDTSEVVSEMEDGDHVHLLRGVYLGTGQPPQDSRFLTLTGAQLQVPDWLKDNLAPADIADAYADLLTRLERVQRVMDGPEPMSPLQIATLRTLIVHSWRRIVLRHPDLPPSFFPKGWKGEDCRSLTHHLLDRLPLPTPATLGTCS